MSDKLKKAQSLLDNFRNRSEGAYVGEFDISIEELSAAVDAAQRLLDDDVKDYDKVRLTGDEEQCKSFTADIVRVSQLLMKMSMAVMDARMMPGSEGVH